MYIQCEVENYVKKVILANILYLEIERVRQYLIEITKNPHSDKKHQQLIVENANQLFRALLLAKEAREKVVENIGDDDSSKTQNSGSSPTHDTS